MSKKRKTWDEALGVGSTVVKVWARDMFNQAKDSTSFVDEILKYEIMLGDILDKLNMGAQQRDAIWAAIRACDPLQKYIFELVQSHKELVSMDSSIKLFHKMKKQARDEKEKNTVELKGKRGSVVIVDDYDGETYDE